MQYLIIGLHVIVCIALVFIVLLQKGKGADMGAAFGGSSQTVFGSSGASSFLSRITTAAAVIFMLTSLSLAFMFGKGRSTSIMEGVQTNVPVAEESAAPAVPASDAVQEDQAGE